MTILDTGTDLRHLQFEEVVDEGRASMKSFVTGIEIPSLTRLLRVVG